MKEKVKTRFLEDIAEHEITIKQDDGCFRHIIFRRPDSGTYRFNLTTWPGYLCISGDMGTYVFSRLSDMFDFFRRDELEINSGYWHEKLVSSCTRCGSEEYSENKFRKYVMENFEYAAEQNGWDEEEKAERLEEVQDQVLCYAEDGLHEAMRAALEFKSDDWNLNDFWEYSLEEYTHHFIWILYAIVWGIQKYDKHGETTS